MADLDPQVQIKLMELAWKWVDSITTVNIRTAEELIEFRITNFDQVYKAMLKTVGEK